MSRKILFVVNPKAGKKKSGPVIPFIQNNFKPQCEFSICEWKDPNDFSEIVNTIKNGNYTDVIAAGGDGTVNRVAQEVINTDIRFGILPLGSGNGLARSLGLSMNLQTCLHQLAQGRSAVIDTGLVNGHPFFCTAGIGFDAHIGTLFASSVKRGLQSYVQISARELLSYKAQTYTLEFEGKQMQRKAFLIAVANAGQYGNDFYIAPQAKLDDGQFHIVILKPFTILKVFGLMRRILQRKAYLAKSIETFSAAELSITRAGVGAVHADGEPMELGEKLVFSNRKQSLKVLVGEHFKAN